MEDNEECEVCNDIEYNKPEYLTWLQSWKFYFKHVFRTDLHMKYNWLHKKKYIKTSTIYFIEETGEYDHVKHYLCGCSSGGGEFEVKKVEKHEDVIADMLGFPDLMLKEFDDEE